MASTYVNLPLLTATITGAATETTLDAVLTELELKANTNEDQQSLLRITKDGSTVTVNKDTATPGNTVGVPVEIVAAAGTPINITAGDLNVQLSDQGANADVTRIGDGTTQLGITASNEAKTHDADVLSQLQTANTTLGTIEDRLTDIMGFETVANLGNGATYNSGILQLSPPYSQVQTHITSDKNGSIDVYWYSDAGGTDLVRTLTLTYTAADGFLVFSAPAFAEYVRYTFTNNSGSAQTDFYFSTKFLVKPISGQILTVSAPISTSMVGALTRSVLVGQSSGGGGSFVNVKVNPSGTLETNANQGGTWNITNISGTISLPTGASTLAEQQAQSTLIGAVNETAPGTDTASSGLNGRLQRIAQRLTSLIALLPSSLGAKTSANSFSVTPASDAVYTTKPKALTGSYAEITSLTTVQTFTAPANAVGALIQADDTNTVNFRAKQGATATSTSGVQFQPGRAEKFDSGSDISVCSESSSVKVYVQWFIQT